MSTAPPSAPASRHRRAHRPWSARARTCCSAAARSAAAVHRERSRAAACSAAAVHRETWRGSSSWLPLPPAKVDCPGAGTARTSQEVHGDFAARAHPGNSPGPSLFPSPKQQGRACADAVATRVARAESARVTGSRITRRSACDVRPGALVRSPADRVARRAFRGCSSSSLPLPPAKVDGPSAGTACVSREIHGDFAARASTRALPRPFLFSLSKAARPHVRRCRRRARRPCRERARHRISAQKTRRPRRAAQDFVRSHGVGAATRDAMARTARRSPGRVRRRVSQKAVPARS